MSFSTPGLTLPETLSLASELGYDGIEPRTGRNHSHRVEVGLTGKERRKVAELASDSGIEICCLALSARFADPSHRAASLEETRRSIDLAAEIGCSRLRIFGGGFPKEMSRERAIASAAEGLRSVSDEAGAAGVTLCLETHDAWTHPDHVAEVMRLVEHPNVAVNWDLMHPFRTSGVPMRDAFKTLQPWIHHVHIHDGTMADPLVLKPCGEGEIDLAGALQCLLEIEYDGFISGEWIDCGDSIRLSDEIERMRAMENQVEGVLLK